MMGASRCHPYADVTATLPPAEYQEEEITLVEFEEDDSLVPSSPQDRAILLRLNGSDAGQIVSLGQRPVLVGRGADSDLVLHDRSVSRKHARLSIEGGQVVCTDLGSRFGTHHNGVARQRMRLRSGDVVRFGQVARFVLDAVSAEQEQVLRNLQEGSVRDALTGAFTRHYFTQRLASECDHARRHATPLSLVILDLDHFKHINDRYGHQAGDAVLRHVAGVVQQRLRSADVLARFGGEEFAVILRRAELEGARRVGERIRAAVAATPVFRGGIAVPVTVSAGCAALTCARQPVPDELIATADRRLYAAKHAGRNRVVVTGGEK